MHEFDFMDITGKHLAFCLSSYMQIIPQEPLRSLLLQASGTRTKTGHHTCVPSCGAHHLGLNCALPHHDASRNCNTDLDGFQLADVPENVSKLQRSNLL